VSQIDSIDLENLLFDSSRRTADIAVSLIGDYPEIFKKFLDFAIRDNGQYTMRAARVIQLACHNHPELIRPYIKEIIHILPTFKSDGLRRNFLKILTERSLNLDEDTLGILVSLSFDYLISPFEKPALKVYAMDILYKISQFCPDIRPELISTIEDQIPRSTMAVKSRGKQILSKLYKQIGTENFDRHKGNRAIGEEMQ
jgi:hypothetical protein